MGLKLAMCYIFETVLSKMTLLHVSLVVLTSNLFQGLQSAIFFDTMLSKSRSVVLISNLFQGYIFVINQC